MVIYRPPGPDAEPEATLSRWSVVEVDLDGAPSRHLVGITADQMGRVTSAIQSFDTETRTAVTRSGRRYTLIGEPGFSGDAQYVLGRWLANNGIAPTDYLVVTHEYVAAPQPREVIFEEGCFDALIEAGVTQEEIDALKADIIESAKSGRLERESRPVTEEDIRKVEEKQAALKDKNRRN